MKIYRYVLFVLTICILLPLAAYPQRRALRVPLNVVIDNVVAQVGGIRSDVLGVYTDGVGGVSAGIDEYGWFGFNTGALGRTVTADYSVVNVINNTGLPVSETLRGSFVTFVTPTKFQDMTNESFQCVGAALTFSYNDTAGTQRSSGYRRGDSDTAWVKVYRQDVNTWILTTGPQSDCSGTSTDGLARVRERKTKGKTTPELVYGTYIMPFKMTLTRKP